VADIAPHKVIPGNRPSNTFLLDQLDAYNLGFLTALYEHSVYVQSLVWNINAFDQWGVELGKQLSGPLFQALEFQAIESPTSGASVDASTNQLLNIARSWRKS
jgi:glucose-6-phosphate isomerase